MPNKFTRGKKKKIYSYINKQKKGSSRRKGRFTKKKKYSYRNKQKKRYSKRKGRITKKKKYSYRNKQKGGAAHRIGRFNVVSTDVPTASPAALLATVPDDPSTVRSLRAAAAAATDTAPPAAPPATAPATAPPVTLYRSRECTLIKNSIIIIEKESGTISFKLLQKMGVGSYGAVLKAEIQKNSNTNQVTKEKGAVNTGENAPGEISLTDKLINENKSELFAIKIFPSMYNLKNYNREIKLWDEINKIENEENLQHHSKLLFTSKYKDNYLFIYELGDQTLTNEYIKEIFLDLNIKIQPVVLDSKYVDPNTGNYWNPETKTNYDTKAEFIYKYIIPKYKIQFFLKIIEQLVKGLKFLHGNNIYHRDIKPANIIILKPDSDSIEPYYTIENSEIGIKLDVPLVKYIDYGLSCSEKQGVNKELMCLNEDAKIATDGTLEYMAPEFIYKNEMKDVKPEIIYKILRKIDIFALGVSLFEIFTGSYLFEKYMKLIDNLCEGLFKNLLKTDKFKVLKIKSYQYMVHSKEEFKTKEEFKIIDFLLNLMIENNTNFRIDTDNLYNIIQGEGKEIFLNKEPYLSFRADTSDTSDSIFNTYNNSFELEDVKDFSLKQLYDNKIMQFHESFMSEPIETQFILGQKFSDLGIKFDPSICYSLKLHNERLAEAEAVVKPTINVIGEEKIKWLEEVCMQHTASFNAIPKLSMPQRDLHDHQFLNKPDLSITYRNDLLPLELHSEENFVFEFDEEKYIEESEQIKYEIELLEIKTTPQKTGRFTTTTVNTLTTEQLNELTQLKKKLEETNIQKENHTISIQKFKSSIKEINKILRTSNFHYI